MLTNNEKRSERDDWHGYYDRATVERANMGSANTDGSDEVYQYVGKDFEPENAWNPETNHKDGPVIGQGIWVTTEFTEKGHLYKQNPVLVIVDKPKIKGFPEGTMIKFKGLLGYRRKKDGKFLFRADDVEVVD